MRTLFVDDDPQTRFLLEFTAKRLNPDWETIVVESGDRALALMKWMPVDVIVADLQMPGMDGAQLLGEVRRRHPGTFRVILTGQADREDAVNCAADSHQFLRKPCSTAALKSALERIAGLKLRLANEKICALVARLSALPSVPALHLELMRALESPDTSLDTIAAIIAQDPAVTAKLLQLVNSAFFGFGGRSSNVLEAIQFLGVSTIRALALGVRVFASFESLSFDSFSANEVWMHSLRTAQRSRRIVELEDGNDVMLDQAFTAGLLHDLGKLILAQNLRQEYRAVLSRAAQRHQPLFQVEQEALQATHAEVGAYLLGLWGLPVPVVEAVAFHHTPAASAQARFSPLTAVHTANSLEAEGGASQASGAKKPLANDYLSWLGLAERVAVWRRESASTEAE